MTSRAQEGKQEQDVGSDEWMYREMYGVSHLEGLDS